MGSVRTKWIISTLRSIFSSVGSEVAIGSILISFLGQPSMGGYSQAAAATFVSFYWGGTMAGRILGSVAMLKVKELLPFWCLSPSSAMVPRPVAERNARILPLRIRMTASN